MKKFILVLIILMVPSILFCNVLSNESIYLDMNKEAEYVNAWCVDVGETEVILQDKTRCDCLSTYFAIEFDFASKWYEGITQALHYSNLTGKNPGLVLIFKKPTDIKYYERALDIINKRNLPIQLWIIKTWEEDLKKTETSTNLHIVSNILKMGGISIE